MMVNPGSCGTSSRRSGVSRDMRPSIAAFVLALALGTPAYAQTPAGTSNPPCAPHEANLGGIGRGGVVAFTAAISGAPVCAVFANVAFDGFDARLGDAPAPDALVSSAVSPGGDVTVLLAGATLSGVGPYVVAPGGNFPESAGDVTEAARVVLAFAGQRVLVIATTPVELVDLTRVLRDRPDLFGADAVERAVVIASGPNAALSLRTDGGVIGAASIAAPSVLSLVRRR
jgi:hypothetical protein